MATTLVTPPTTDPVTLVEAKSHCRVDIDDDDGLLAGYILTARQHLETETRRAFATQTWDLTIDEQWPATRVNGCYRNRIVLPRPPVQSVTSISYIDGAGATQVLAANQYKLAKADTGEWFIDPAYGVAWPTIRREMAAVTIRFVAGYGNGVGQEPFPEPLRQAMLLLIGSWYENREAIVIGTIVNELPLAVASLVFPFRVFY